MNLSILKAAIGQLQKNKIRIKLLIVTKFSLFRKHIF